MIAGSVESLDVEEDETHFEVSLVVCQSEEIPCEPSIRRRSGPQLLTWLEDEFGGRAEVGSDRSTRSRRVEVVLIVICISSGCCWCCCADCSCSDQRYRLGRVGEGCDRSDF